MATKPTVLAAAAFLLGAAASFSTDGAPGPAGRPPRCGRSTSRRTRAWRWSPARGATATRRSSRSIFPDPARTTSRPGRSDARTTSRPMPAARPSTTRHGSASTRRRSGRRRGHGKLGFNWYRISGDGARRRSAPSITTGTNVVFEIDARRLRPRSGSTASCRGTLGQSGRQPWSAGWNAPNRLVVGPRRAARPADPARDLRDQRSDLESADELHLAARRAASSSTPGTRRRSRSRRRK